MKHYLSRKVKIVLAVAVILAVGLAALSNVSGLSFHSGDWDFWRLEGST